MFFFMQILIMATRIFLLQVLFKSMEILRKKSQKRLILRYILSISYLRFRFLILSFISPQCILFRMFHNFIVIFNLFVFDSCISMEIIIFKCQKAGVMMENYALVLMVRVLEQKCQKEIIKKIKPRCLFSWFWTNKQKKQQCTSSLAIEQALHTSCKHTTYLHSFKKTKH